MVDTWHRGDWMQTFSGKRFYPLAPHPADVDIVDIAHHLSMICRYGGAAKFHYSVAQHCVLMAECAPREHKLRALLHDAAEAYVGDMVRPLKKSREMIGFGIAERAVELAVCNALKISYPIANDVVHDLDNRILLDEREQVMTVTDHDWSVEGESLGVIIDEWKQAYARQRFLRAYEQYCAWHNENGVKP